jgi:hypothetical protein
MLRVFRNRFKLVDERPLVRLRNASDPSSTIAGIC